MKPIIKHLLKSCSCVDFYLRISKIWSKSFYDHRVVSYGGIFFRFQSDQTSENRKTRKKTGKFAWLTMWLTELENFFSVIQCIFIQESEKWAQFCSLKFRSGVIAKKPIKSLIRRCYRLWCSMNFIFRFFFCLEGKTLLVFKIWGSEDLMFRF